VSLCVLRVLDVCRSMFLVHDSLHLSLYIHHIIIVFEACFFHFIVFVFVAFVVFAFVALRCNLDVVDF
jgi:hypothetical protein